MNSFIDYFNYVFSHIISILDSIKLPGSISLLRYMLIAIILGIIFRLVKGGANEFDSSTNFMNGRIISSLSYNMSNSKRKEQLIKARNGGLQDGIVAGISLSNDDYSTARDFVNRG